MSASLVSVEEKKDAFGKPSRDRGSGLSRRACERGASHPRQERSFDRVSQASSEREERSPPIRAGLAPPTANFFPKREPHPTAKFRGSSPNPDRENGGSQGRGEDQRRRNQFVRGPRTLECTWVLDRLLTAGKPRGEPLPAWSACGIGDPTHS